MDESAKQSCYNYLLWVLESGALAAYTSSPLPPVMLCVPSLFFRAHHTLLFTRPAFCVWERVWVWISGLIISDRDVTGVWQSSICHNWHLYPITFLVCFFSMKLTKCWHLWCFQPDTLQWTGNSEDSDKATAAQAGGEKEELFTQAVQEERRGKDAVRKKERKKWAPSPSLIVKVFSRHAVRFWG